jgi:uncharacterized protein GlcG (DUF336 family)
MRLNWRMIFLPEPGDRMATISLRRARTIIRKTLDAGRAAEMKPLSVIVLDAGGNIQAFEREDGASPGRFQIAHGKAYGAVMLGMAGTAQKQRAEAQAYFINAANGALGGQMIPVPGGVLVRDAKGNIIGAVGVTGDTSDNDAAAATAGIDAVGLTAEI